MKTSRALLLKTPHAIPGLAPSTIPLLEAQLLGYKLPGMVSSNEQAIEVLRNGTYPLIINPKGAMELSSS